MKKKHEICTQICILGIIGHIWHIWAREIWSSGVSLKRSCKMQFRGFGLRSLGTSSQKVKLFGETIKKAAKRGVSDSGAILEIQHL